MVRKKIHFTLVEAYQIIKKSLLDTRDMSLDLVIILSTEGILYLLS